MAMNTMDGTPPAGGNEMPAESAGYKLCLLIGGDGAMSVGVESENADAELASDAAAPGGGGVDDSMEGYKPVQSLAEAMSLFKEIMANDGKMPEDSSAQDMASAKSGYNRFARKTPDATSPGAVFGD